MASLDDIEILLKDQSGSPPIDAWHPELSGDIDIVIKADGRWIHEGGEIKRHTLVKLFASILRCEDDGDHYLVTPVEKWRVQVEDLPLLIIDLEYRGEGCAARLAVKTNVDSWFELGAEHPLKVLVDDSSGEPRPEVLTKHGLLARVNRACFYRMVDMAKSQGKDLVLKAGGEAFVLGQSV
jgi:hypothetical protein